MPARRPPGVTPLALLNIIFGGLYLLCGLCSGTEPTVTVNNQDRTQELKDFMVAEVPGYTALRITGLVTSTILAAGLVVSGAGMLRLAPWSRTLALVCAALAILQQIGLALFYQLVVTPARARFLNQGPAGGLGGFLASFVGWLVVLGAIVAVTYNVVLLVLLLSPKMARAFSGQGADGEEMEEDEEEEGPPRRPARRRPPREIEEEEEMTDPEQGPARRRQRPRKDDDEPPPRRPPRPRD
jgi:hypothetical protein